MSRQDGFLIPNNFRWLPQINTSRFRYDASPFARISNSCEITKNAATRWMTFVKNPSPCPIPRMNPERKSSATDACCANNGSAKTAKNESPKWEPIRKFAPPPAKTDEEPGQKQDESGSNRDLPTTKQSPDANEQSQRLTQRMRDLYDFKTENEWPKRATNNRRGNSWISKSSSEEEKNNQSARRNSQDLEFNNRFNVIKLKDTKVKSDHQEPKRASKKDPEVLNSEYEERLRKFNERLRFSEDLGVVKPKLKERRTFSDDYEEKTRRASTRSAREASSRKQKSEDSSENRYQVEKKRSSDASSKSRGSYAEVNPVKRDSRTSEVSYASISNNTGKRASVDCKGSSKMVELPPRRAFSQTEERPSTPVPPVEWNDDRYATARLKEISERQKRDSTRYKVYLT